jgi:hypothetical protein
MAAIVLTEDTQSLPLLVLTSNLRNLRINTSNAYQPVMLVTISENFLFFMTNR